MLGGLGLSRLLLLLGHLLLVKLILLDFLHQKYLLLFSHLLLTRILRRVNHRALGGLIVLCNIVGLTGGSFRLCCISLNLMLAGHRRLSLSVLTCGCNTTSFAFDENVRMRLSRASSTNRHLHVVTFRLCLAYKLLVRLLLLGSRSNSLHIVLAGSKCILTALARCSTSNSTDASLDLVREIVRL